MRLESLLRLRHRVANAKAANARLHVSPPPEHGGQTGGGSVGKGCDHGVTTRSGHRCSQPSSGDHYRAGKPKFAPSAFVPPTRMSVGTRNARVHPRFCSGISARRCVKCAGWLHKSVHSTLCQRQSWASACVTGVSVHNPRRAAFHHRFSCLYFKLKRPKRAYFHASMNRRECALF